MITIHSNPTTALIREAHRSMHEGILHWPYRFRDGTYWTDWWQGGNDARHCRPPVMVVEDTTPVALIVLTNYRYDHRSAECHFCAGAMRNPVAVFRAVKQFFYDTAQTYDLNILYGHIPASAPKAIRVARLLGFKEVASTGGIWYSAKTINGD